MNPQQPYNPTPNPDPNQQYPQPYPPQYQGQQQPMTPQPAMPPTASPSFGQPIPQQPLSGAQPPQPNTAQPTNLHPMVVLQPGERVVAVIKRHPFGILSLYIGGLVAIIIAVAMAFFLLPRLFTSYGTSDANLMIYTGLAIVVAGMVLILGIATTVYWQNQWTVTTDSITQVSQRSLFTRQVSQLSMDNLEDVTVDQAGIIPHLFNFGTLKVETAGERSKFQFAYCPNPTEYARRILEVHEQFLDDRRNVQNTP